jgi:hypothetical protein
MSHPTNDFSPARRRRSSTHRTLAGLVACAMLGGLFVSTNVLGGGALAADPKCIEDEKNGLSGGTRAAIAGGAAAAAIAAAAFGSGAGVAGGVAGGVGAAQGTVGAFPIGADVDCDEDLPALEGNPGKITGIRLLPEQSYLKAGWQRCFMLQVRSNGQWRSVTKRGETHFYLADTTNAQCVMQMDMKNVWGVPAGVSQNCNGQSVIIGGEFMGHTAEARVIVVAP